MARQPRTTVALYVRIDPKLKERLGALADRSNETEAAMVERVLLAFVERGAK